MSFEVTIEPLDADSFAPFGDVLEVGRGEQRVINQGLCNRWHDLARIDLTDGRAGISLFDGVPRSLPLVLDMVERHPDGSQAFLPMTEHPFLVIVAPETGHGPGRPRAFRSHPGQGVNYHRGTWHGVLTPLAEPGLFAVIDRIGPGANLQEHWFDTPFTVMDPAP